MKNCYVHPDLLIGTAKLSRLTLAVLPKVRLTPSELPIIRLTLAVLPKVRKNLAVLPVDSLTLQYLCCLSTA